MEMLKDFPVKKYLNKKNPSDNSNTTKEEIKELTKIPIRESFVKENDNIEAVFKKVAKKKNIEDYDPKLVVNLIKKSAPIILDLKKYFNRPRPKSMAKKLNIKMDDIEMDSMKTPSYPSGHSTQGVLIAKVLGDKHPKAKSAFAKAAKNISYSRNVAHAHYKSDSKMGENLGKEMYNHIKNKI